MKKDTLYIDLEDDITGIIDKVTSSKSKIVALVPPKRSTVLQSVVNMKLLKKTLTAANKTIVIVSNDRVLESLAGGVGLHIAKDLKSKPYIPEAPDIEAADESIIEGTRLDDMPNKTIGQLDDEHNGVVRPPVAEMAASAAPKSHIDLSGEALSTKVDVSSNKQKKLKVPNFERFRIRILLGVVAVIVLIFGWWLAFVQLPSAEVFVKAKTSRIGTKFDFVADTALEKDNIDKHLLVATSKELKKTVNEKFTTTGKKDVGKKATGVITVENCSSPTPITIPSGTGYSSNGLTFISSEAVTVPGGSGSFDEGCTVPGTADVSVVAQKSGDDYNLASGSSYSIAGQSSSVSGTGGQMSGGTSETVAVVSQADVDTATAKLLVVDESAAKKELKDQFGEDVVILEDSFSATNGEVVSQPEVGEEAKEGQVTVQFTYTMLAVSDDSVSDVLTAEQEKKLGDAQSIYKSGIDDATYSLATKTSNGKMTFSLSTNGFIGPDIDTQEVADSIKGKRYSEAVEIVKKIPGVNEVTINFSPFWVFSAPKNTDKITITLEVADSSAQQTE